MQHSVKFKQGLNIYNCKFQNEILILRQKYSTCLSLFFYFLLGSCFMEPTIRLLYSLRKLYLSPHFLTIFGTFYHNTQGVRWYCRSTPGMAHIPNFRQTFQYLIILFYRVDHGEISGVKTHGVTTPRGVQNPERLEFINALCTFAIDE